LATIFTIELIRKSGVREWEDATTRQAITAAAIEMAMALQFTEGTAMALPDYFRVQNGTTKTIKNSGGDAAITLASLANNSARQAVKLDLGDIRAEVYVVRANCELAATPTAGNVVDLYWAPSLSATAGTDNPANVSGTDAAYTGYASNIDASVKQLLFIGSFICTAQATSTVQKAHVGLLAPPTRYGCLVVYNKAGSAFHSTDTNQQIELVPLHGVVED
jgi:hypothetical protein